MSYLQLAPDFPGRRSSLSPARIALDEQPLTASTSSSPIGLAADRRQRPPAAPIQGKLGPAVAVDVEEAAGQDQGADSFAGDQRSRRRAIEGNSVDEGELGAADVSLRQARAEPGAGRQRRAFDKPWNQWQDPERDSPAAGRSTLLVPVTYPIAYAGRR